MAVSDNPVSALIKEYDRSNFTHVGIDVGDGSVVSCRTESDLLRQGEDGGVRIDELADLAAAGIRCYRVPVDRTRVDAAARAAAVKIATGWAEPGGRGTRSAFSFPKMVQCAVAIEASRPGCFDDDARTDMLDAAFAAARAWAYDGNDASFFCAEMVVEAYGWKIPFSTLAPPATVPDDDVLRAADAADADGLVERIKQAWAAGRKAATMVGVLAAVVRHDPEFMLGAASALLRWSGFDSGEEPVRGASDTEFLPSAIVSPRMLLACDWVGEVDPVPLT